MIPYDDIWKPYLLGATPLASRQLYWILLRSHFPFSCWACYFLPQSSSCGVPPSFLSPYLVAMLHTRPATPYQSFAVLFFFFRKERSSVIYLLTSKTPWLKEGDKKQKQQPEAPEPRSVACPTDLSQYIRTWEKARLKVYTFIKKRGDIQNPPGLLSGSPHLPFPCHLFNNLRRKKNCRRRGGPGGFHHNTL